MSSDELARHILHALEYVETHAVDFTQATPGIAAFAITGLVLQQHVSAAREVLAGLPQSIQGRAPHLFSLLSHFMHHLPEPSTRLAWRAQLVAHIRAYPGLAWLWQPTAGWHVSAGRQARQVWPALMTAGAAALTPFVIRRLCIGVHGAPAGPDWLSAALPCPALPRALPSTVRPVLWFGPFAPRMRTYVGACVATLPGVDCAPMHGLSVPLWMVGSGWLVEAVAGTRAATWLENACQVPAMSTHIAAGCAASAQAATARSTDLLDLDAALASTAHAVEHGIAAHASRTVHELWTLAARAPLGAWSPGSCYDDRPCERAHAAWDSAPTGVPCPAWQQEVLRVHDAIRLPPRLPPLPHAAQACTAALPGAGVRAWACATQHSWTTVKVAFGKADGTVQCIRMQDAGATRCTSQPLHVAPISAVALSASSRATGIAVWSADAAGHVLGWRVQGQALELAAIAAVQAPNPGRPSCSPSQPGLYHARRALLACSIRSPGFCRRSSGQRSAPLLQVAGITALAACPVSSNVVATGSAQGHVCILSARAAQRCEPGLCAVAEPALGPLCVAAQAITQLHWTRTGAALIAADAAGWIHVLCAYTGQCLRVFSAHGLPAASLPSKRELPSGSPGAVTMLHAAAPFPYPACISAATIHMGAPSITCMSLSTCGQWLIVGSASGTVWLCHVDAGPLCVLAQTGCAVHRVWWVAADGCEDAGFGVAALAGISWWKFATAPGSSTQRPHLPALTSAMPAAHVPVPTTGDVPLAGVQHESDLGYVALLIRGAA